MVILDWCRVLEFVWNLNCNYSVSALCHYSDNKHNKKVTKESLDEEHISRFTFGFKILLGGDQYAYV